MKYTEGKTRRHYEQKRITKKRSEELAIILQNPSHVWFSHNFFVIPKQKQQHKRKWKKGTYCLLNAYRSRPGYIVWLLAVYLVYNGWVTMVLLFNFNMIESMMIDRSIIRWWLINRSSFFFSCQCNSSISVISFLFDIFRDPTRSSKRREENFRAEDQN